ncbi:MAG: ABC transporter ATP-binding protein [Sphingopyxis sp.]|nr:ABC transporter ATP-binding protein [Sphingopyxis sp.]
MNAGEPGLEMRNVAVAYGSHRVLDGISLSVGAGEIYALLGGNGAGKSTTLSTLLGFIRPTAGHVRVGGIDPAADPDAARRLIAYLPENVALYEHLSARENVAYLLALSDQRQEDAAIDDAFTATGLQADAWDKRLAGFSKGMRQKVAIAVALLRHVPVLLLDEPTSGLDPRATSDFGRLVANVRDRGAAVLMVTHDLLSAAEIADRIGFLDSGRIVDEVTADGPDRFDVRALHHKFGAAPAVATAA